uniref:Uncharacterized protein n=1 Tax=Rhizophora mucronata TaxID=61149 RepID=A0A2P2KLP4_RHIMU
MFSNINTLSMSQVIPNSSFIRAVIRENVANPSEKLLNPIQLLNNSLGSANVIMIIRNSRIRLPVRNIKRSNGWLPTFPNLFPDDLPVLLVGPDGVPPGLIHLHRSVHPQLLQILFRPILFVFGKIEQVFVVGIPSLLLFLHLLHALAFQ